LAASGAVAEPMPDAVLDRVLRSLPDRGAPGAAEDSKITRVISLNDHRKRRQVIWANLAKAAAALVILAGIGVGLGYVTQHSATSNTSSSGASNSEAEPKAAQGLRAPAPIPTEASGHDYTNEMAHALAGADGASVSPRAIPPRSFSAGTPGSTPPALSRLSSGGLDACITAVASRFGSQPISADFAFYRGQPALVFTLANGLLVAVGPECGLPGTGADALATNR